LSAAGENRTPEENAKNIEWLRNLPTSGLSRRELYNRKTEVSQLPKWVKHSIELHDVDGLSWRAIANKKKRSPKTIQSWMSCPAAKKWRKALAEVIESPTETVRLKATADSKWAYNEMLRLYRACVASGDYTNARHFLAQIHELSGLKQAAQTQTAAIVQITMQGGTPISTEIVMGESSAEKVLPADIDEEA
jgi:hypothetical protein